MSEQQQAVSQWWTICIMHWYFLEWNNSACIEWNKAWWNDLFQFLELDSTIQVALKHIRTIFQVQNDTCIDLIFQAWSMTRGHLAMGVTASREFKTTKDLHHLHCNDNCNFTWWLEYILLCCGEGCLLLAFQSHGIICLILLPWLCLPCGILVAKGDESNAPASQQILSWLALHCHTYVWWICTTNGTVYIQSLLQF